MAKSNSTEFALLQSRCVEVLRAPDSAPALEALADVLQSKQTTLYADLVLVPLVESLRFSVISTKSAPAPGTERRFLAWCRCFERLLCTVTERTHFSLDEAAALNLLDWLSRAACSQLARSSSGGGAEDCATVILCALRRLVEVLNDSALIGLYRPSNLPLLGFLVSQALDAARQCRATALCRAGLELLSIIVQPAQMSDYSEEIARALACVLPGVVQTLAGDLLIKEVGQSSFVKVRALEVFGNVCSIVFGDNVLELVSQVDEELEFVGVDPKVKCCLIHRNDSWRRGTAQKLVQLMVAIAAARLADRSWRVRRALATVWSTSLLQSCAGSLGLLADVWQDISVAEANPLVVLLTLVGDSVALVEKAATESLTQLRAQLGERIIAERVGSCVHVTCLRLPRLLGAAGVGGSTDEIAACAELRCLRGGLLCLSPVEVSRLTRSVVHLRRLLSALCVALQPDTRMFSILVSSDSPAFCTTTDSHDIDDKPKLVWRYRHVMQATTLELLHEVTGLLGSRGDLDTTLEVLLEWLQQQDYQDQKENEGFEEGGTLTVLNIILSAASECSLSIEMLLRIQEVLLQNLCYSKRWTDDGSGCVGSSHVGAERRIAARTCLILQCVISLARGFAAVGRSEDWLQSTLLWLLELAGGANVVDVVQEAAKTALAQVAVDLGCSSIGSLLQENADYLADGLSRQLRRNECGRVGAALCAILACSSAAVLLSLEGLLYETLEHVDLQEAGGGGVTLLPVLSVLVERLVIWFPVPVSVLDTTDETQQQLCGGPSLVAFLQNEQQHLIEWRRSCQPVTSTEEPVEEDHLDAEEKWKRVLEQPGDKPEVQQQEQLIKESSDDSSPPQLRLLHQTLERCLQLLSSEAPCARLLCLRTMCRGLPLLAACEDLFLPLVARLWPALLPRFRIDGDSQQETDVRVAVAAIDTLAMLAVNAGDFVRQRVSRDVLGSLRQLVHRWASLAVAHPHRLPRLHSLECRALLRLVRRLGLLCKYLRMSVSQMEPLMASLVTLLRLRQWHPGSVVAVALAEAAAESLRCIDCQQPGLVWLYVHRLQLQL